MLKKHLTKLNIHLFLFYILAMTHGLQNPGSLTRSEPEPTVVKAYES